MPTTQLPKALARFWLRFTPDGDDSPDAFTVLPQRLMYVGLIAIAVITITAVRATA